LKVPTTADLIGRYIALRDHIDQMQKDFETSLVPYKDAMTAIEGAVTVEINALGNGHNSIKTEQGTAFRQEWSSVKVADRESFLDFVFDGRREGFLTSAVPKDAVKEFCEAHNGQPPPGVDVVRGYKTVFRKAS
jgi:hypothetical protein